MANTKSMVMGLVVALIMAFDLGVSAQSSCTDVLLSMSPCLNYITGNSLAPSSECCSNLGNVVRSSPQCLCEALRIDRSQLGLTVNMTQALALPRACNVQTPSITICNGGSPEGSPIGSPEGSSTPSGDGSKSTPSSERDGSSDAGSIKSSISLLTLFFTLSYAVISAFY